MEVFDELCPPPCIEHINMKGYFGNRLPRWMMSTSTIPLKSLRLLTIRSLACCTQLPDGLCQLPCLEVLTITDCKLRCIPPGLASHARALKKLTIWSVQGLQALENLASVVQLDLFDLPNLINISNFPKLQKLEIDCCQKLESLQGMDQLRRLVLTVHYDRPIPSYLQTVKPSHLSLDCGPEALACMALGKSGPEWDKFGRIQHVEAYADDPGEHIEKKWHLFYTSEPYIMVTNIHPQLICFLNLLSLIPFHLSSSAEWSWSEKECEDVEDVEDSLDSWRGRSDKLRRQQHSIVNFPLATYTYNDDGEHIEKKWHLFYTSEPYSMVTNIDPQYMEEQQDEKLQPPGVIMTNDPALTLAEEGVTG
uniref:R13L1/DRL21-like LRR repeat region domain-containing protein n=1 Tax=Aegilops tauschii TaxID=37682 RepID=M8B563_AEGTA